MIEASSHQTHVARKIHKCNYCNGIIQVGTRYNRDGIVHDGRAYTWKSHLFCQGVVNRLADWSHTDGVDPDYFYELVFHECWRIIGHNPSNDKMTLQDMIKVIEEGGPHRNT